MSRRVPHKKMRHGICADYLSAVSIAGTRQVVLHEALLITPERPVDLLALDRALEALASVDGLKTRVVELRFFGGLSVDETATVLGVSAETVKRDWRIAKLWLERELNGETNPATLKRQA